MSKFKQVLKKIGASLLAALSTPEAIKAEKYIAVVGLTRAALLIPVGYVVVHAVIDAAIKYLGG